MCMPKPPKPAAPIPQAPPPPPPPPPAPTAQGLTVGADRQTAPLSQFLPNQMTARRGTAALRTDMGGISPVAGNGINAG